jgi:hypothetical protein
MSTRHKRPDRRIIINRSGTFMPGMTGDVVFPFKEKRKVYDSDPPTKPEPVLLPVRSVDRFFCDYSPELPLEKRYGSL